MVLTNMFEEVVKPAFHSGSREIATKGFVTTPLVDILADIQRLYGKPSYQDTDAALLHLNEPMNSTQSVEFMLIGIEEVQLLLLANPDEDHTLTKLNLISYALIKLTKTRGMYAKGIEKWKKMPSQDRIKWAKFSTHMVEDYNKQLTKTGVTTISQEGYGTSMHAAEDLTDGD